MDVEFNGSINREEIEMNTFNTYQEAKINNPERDIYYTMIANDGKDAVFGLFDELNKFTSVIHKCNPADYCITVENESFDVMAQDNEAAEAKAVAEYSNEKPKRFRVEYVKHQYETTWDAVVSFENGEEFYRHRNKDGYTKVIKASEVVSAYESGRLYNRIETEIDERQAFIEAMIEIHTTAKNWSTDYFFGEIYDSGKFKLVD